MNVNLKRSSISELLKKIASQYEHKDVIAYYPELECVRGSERDRERVNYRERSVGEKINSFSIEESVVFLCEIFVVVVVVLTRI